MLSVLYSVARMLSEYYQGVIRMLSECYQGVFRVLSEYQCWHW